MANQKNKPKYQYKELIFDPDDNRLAMLRGRKVYFGNNPKKILDIANNDPEGRQAKPLDAWDGTSDFPFLVQGKCWMSILPCKGLKTQYIPFKDKMEFVKEYDNRIAGFYSYGFEGILTIYGIWLKKKETYHLVTSITEEGVIIEGTEISWKEMIAIYSFPDGEPAGTRKQYL